MELCRRSLHSGGCIHGRFTPWHSQVALRINRVIIAEVGNRCHGDAGTEAIGVRQGVQRERTAPAPAPPTQALAVQLRVFCYHLVDGCKLVGQLHLAEVPVGGLLKVAASIAHAAVVDMQHGKAVLGQQVVKIGSLPSPGVCYRCGSGAAIGAGNQRNARGIGPAFRQ